MIAILVVILAALGLMLAVAVFYQGRKLHEEPRTSAPKETVKIEDITNAPSEADQQAGQTEKTAEKTTAPKEKEQETAAQEKTEQETEEQETTTQEAAEKTDTQTYIRQVNEASFGMEGSHLTDITALTEITAKEVRTLIEAYTVPDCTYLDGAERTEGDFDYAMLRRNLSGLTDPIELRYGVLKENSLIRAFPTWQKLSNGTSSDDPDYLQESMFSMGEGVAVLHQSEDQIWSFVQGQNYSGWIQTSTIAFCTREEMSKFAKPERFAVVISPSVTVGNFSLRMGSILPLTGKGEESWTLLVPKADENGNLVTQETQIPAGDLSEGYLPLSEDAMTEQAKKLLGTNYGWGDSNEYMDCTSTLRAVYNCFGITLPRNSSWMKNCGLKVTDLQEMSAEQKQEVISSLPKGSILLIRGHAMMYIGEEDGTASMLHNVTQYRLTADAELERPLKCVITPLTICNSAGVSYMDLYLYAISVDWSRIEG